MFKRSVDRQIVREFSETLALMALTAPALGQVTELTPMAGATGLGQPTAFIRPMEADFSVQTQTYLVTDAGQPGGPGIIMEWDDPQSNVVWSYGPATGGGALKDPSAAESLGNGEVAIADTGNHRVLIVNHTGQITWNSANVTFSDGKQLRGPVDIRILPDSTPSMSDNPILITCKANNRVVVVTRAGQVAWAMNAGLSAPLKAERLANGNTLITDSGNHRVIEVNTSKQIVASFHPNYPTDSHLASAKRLPDGSTFILDAGYGQLLQYWPNQSEPEIADTGNHLVGGTDIDAGGEFDWLLTTPAAILQGTARNWEYLAQVSQ